MSVMKNVLLKIYGEVPEIVEMLSQVDFTSLEVQWNKEMDLRISKEDAILAESILASDLILRYNEAILGATMAMTRPLNDILDLITIPQTGKLN